jgi:hypothetical protein
MRLLGILTALLGFALVAVGGEEFGSKENWTAPAAEAQKKNAVAVTVLAKNRTASADCFENSMRPHKVFLVENAEFPLLASEIPAAHSLEPLRHARGRASVTPKVTIR